MKNRFGLQSLKIMVLCSVFAALQSMPLYCMVTTEVVSHRVEAMRQAEQQEQAPSLIALTMTLTLDQWGSFFQEQPFMREIGSGVCPPIITPVDMTIFVDLMDHFIQSFARRVHTRELWARPFSSERHFYVEKEKAALQETVYAHADLHGDVKSLMLFLQELRAKGVIDNHWRIRPENRVIFLGDYIDRGFYGLEVLYTLMILAYNNPERVTLIRGNHENKSIYVRYNGNEMEGKIKALGQDSITFFEQLDRFFETLPSALYLQKIDGRYLLYAHASHNHEHRTLQKFLSMNTMYDSLASAGYSWGDYDCDAACIEDVRQSPRGPGVVQYSQQGTLRWMNEHAIDIIVHGHAHDGSCLCNARVYGLRVSPDTISAVIGSNRFYDEKINRLYVLDEYARVQIRQGRSTIEVINLDGGLQSKQKRDFSVLMYNNIQLIAAICIAK
jgi:hypothetical protein